MQSFKQYVTGGAPLDKPTHTPEQIALKHSVSLEKILSQLEKGIEVEAEHTSDKAAAREIALDHLWERADYYTKLAAANL